MDKYRIAIVVNTVEVETFDFSENQKEEAMICYYRNNLFTDQYTRLYVDGEPIKGHKKIEKIFGGKPDIVSLRFKGNSI